MRTTFRLAALLLLGGAGTLLAAAPVGWRGDGSGRFPDAKPPAKWGEDTNLLWKASLPGNSFGSPIVVGDNLLVASDPTELLCVRRSDGKVVWKKSVSDVKGSAGGGGRGKFGKGGGGRGGMGGGMGRSAGNSAATPVSDGQHVAAVFGNGVVAVYKLDGTRLWAKFVEGPQIMFGHAASPLLLDGKVIVHVKDLVALDVATGKEKWRKKLPAAHASPVAAKLGKEDVIVSPAGAVVRPGDGEVLGQGKFRAQHGTPVVDGDTIYLSNSGALKAVKITPGDDGKVTFKTLWSAEVAQERQRLPSPLVHDGLMYSVGTAGVMDVIDLKTGDRVYRQRVLDGGQVYSSLAMAGGLIYAFNLTGKAAVFKPGRKFERVATNELEGTGSSPVFAGDHLYVRGRRALYCLSAKAPAKEGKEKAGE
jgi:outer membrane protein assembly factor BamB